MTGMATPLHHDQPQRALQNVGIYREEHTEKSKSSRVRNQGTSPFQHNENLASPPDSSFRRSVQQLPPRSSHFRQPQPHLRKRRPESSSPYGPIEENLGHCISSPQSDHLHANSCLEECRPSYPDHHHINSPTESYIQYARSFPKEHWSDHPHAGRTPDFPYCVSSNSGVRDAKEGDRFQELERHATTENSYPLDYKAAILREVPASHTLKHHQYVNHDNYFGCTEEDKKQQSQSKSSGNTVFEQKQHVVVDSSEVRHVNASDNSHTGVEHTEQINSGHIVSSFSELSTHEIQAEINAEVDASEQSLRTESNSQQLHQELSQSSSDDSYCHVSKEAVEREYQNDCHLATPLDHQEQSQPQPCSTLVYDYARAGVTFSSSNEQQSDNLCNTEKDALNDRKDLDNHDCGIAHDDQRGRNSQQQDVESPPLFLGFNHFCTRFAFSTSKGFRVYDIDTMRECFSCAIGGVGFVEPCFNTDLFLLVGGGPKPSFPLNTVVIWDAVKGKSIAQLTHKVPIIAVKAYQERLVVVLEHEVCVYNFSNARHLFQVHTMSNIKGLCALSMEEGPLVLACPGLKKGEVRVEHIGMSGKQGEVPSRNGFDVSAHDSGLACVALNSKGSLLATASYRGTLVRIFSAKDGALLQELRRGLDKAEIYSLAFSLSSDWLVVSSDKGTVHIFGVRTLDSNSSDIHGVASAVRNPGSTLSFIKGVLPKYFQSEWSYAQFKLPEEIKSVVAFGQESQRVFVLGTNGRLYKFLFDSEHGDMKLLECLNFFKSREQKLDLS